MVLDRFPNVDLIQLRSNLGFPGGVNAGLARVENPAIFLLNSDVYLLNGAAGKLCAQLFSSEDIGLVGPAQFSLNGRQLLTFHTDHTLKSEFLETFLFMDVWRYRIFGERIASAIQDPREVHWLSGSALMLKSEMIAEIGGMDANVFMYGEEYDLQRRGRDSGWRMIYAPHAKVIHEKSVSADAYFSHRRLAEVTVAQLYFSAKHSGKKVLFIIVPLRVLRSTFRLLLGLVIYLEPIRKFGGLAISGGRAAPPHARLKSPPQFSDRFLFDSKRASEHVKEHIEVIKQLFSKSTYNQIRSKLGKANKPDQSPS